MFNKEDNFEKDIRFIVEQLKPFQQFLADDDFMKSFAGKAVKKLIKGNECFQRIDKDMKYKRKIIQRLKEYFDETTLMKAMRNIY
jgi:hypothetical protein